MVARKGGGGKLARSETITVRLDPKLRFGAELAARKQRRTLSSFIEWAVDEALDRVNIYTEAFDGPDQELSAKEAMNKTWSVHEADRFTNLAQKFPFLLTHDEEVLWILIYEHGYFNDPRHIKRRISPIGLRPDRIREHWELLKKVAKGKADKSELPPAPDPRSMEDDDVNS